MSKKKGRPRKAPTEKKAPRQSSSSEDRQAYEPPTLERIDLAGLSNDVIDDAGRPLLAQESGGNTVFPPPPTSPPQ